MPANNIIFSAASPLFAAIILLCTTISSADSIFSDDASNAFFFSPKTISSSIPTSAPKHTSTSISVTDFTTIDPSIIIAAENDNNNINEVSPIIKERSNNIYVLSNIYEKPSSGGSNRFCQINALQTETNTYSSTLVGQLNQEGPFVYPICNYIESAVFNNTLIFKVFGYYQLIMIQESRPFVATFDANLQQLGLIHPSGTLHRDVTFAYNQNRFDFSSASSSSSSGLFDGNQAQMLFTIQKKASSSPSSGGDNSFFFTAMIQNTPSTYTAIESSTPMKLFNNNGGDEEFVPVRCGRSSLSFYRSISSSSPTSTTSFMFHAPVTSNQGKVGVSLITAIANSSSSFESVTMNSVEDLTSYLNPNTKNDVLNLEMISIVLVNKSSILLASFGHQNLFKLFIRASTGEVIVGAPIGTGSVGDSLYSKSTLYSVSAFMFHHHYHHDDIFHQNRSIFASSSSLFSSSTSAASAGKGSAWILLKDVVPVRLFQVEFSLSYDDDGSSSSSSPSNNNNITQVNETIGFQNVVQHSDVTGSFYNGASNIFTVCSTGRMLQFVSSSTGVITTTTITTGSPSPSNSNTSTITTATGTSTSIATSSSTQVETSSTTVPTTTTVGTETETETTITTSSSITETTTLSPDHNHNHSHNTNNNNGSNAAEEKRKKIEIIGGAVGGVVALALCGLLIYRLTISSRRRQQSNYTDHDSQIDDRLVNQDAMSVDSGISPRV